MPQYSWFDEKRSGNLASAGIEWKGDWSPVKIYRKGDIVSYDGAVFIAKVSNVSKLPSDTSYEWSVFIDRFEGEAFIWQGQWINSFAYQPNDIVGYQGSSYIAIADSLNVLPTSTIQWNLLAAQGSGTALTAGNNISINSNVISLSNDISLDTATFGANAFSTTYIDLSGINISIPGTGVENVYNSGMAANFMYATAVNNTTNLYTLLAMVSNYQEDTLLSPAILFAASQSETMRQIVRKPSNSVPSEFSIELNTESGVIPIFHLREQTNTPRLTIPNLGNAVLASPFTQILVADDLGNIISTSTSNVISGNSSSSSSSYTAGANINIAENVISLTSSVNVLSVSVTDPSTPTLSSILNSDGIICNFNDTAHGNSITSAIQPGTFIMENSGSSYPAPAFYRVELENDLFVSRFSPTTGTTMYQKADLNTNLSNIAEYIIGTTLTSNNNIDTPIITFRNGSGVIPSLTIPNISAGYTTAYNKVLVTDSNGNISCTTTLPSTSLPSNNIDGQILISNSSGTYFAVSPQATNGILLNSTGVNPASFTVSIDQSSKPVVSGMDTIGIITSPSIILSSDVGSSFSRCIVVNSGSELFDFYVDPGMSYILILYAVGRSNSGSFGSVIIKQTYIIQSDESNAISFNKSEDTNDFLGALNAVTVTPTLSGSTITFSANSAVISWATKVNIVRIDTPPI